MGRIVNYICFIIIFSFIYVINCKAECSYQERKDLLNAAKNVEIFYEIDTKTETVESINSDTGETVVENMEIEFFKFYISGVTDNFFIKVSNDIDAGEFYINKKDLKDGFYTFNVENRNDLINYTFKFYSNNTKCLGYEIYTEKVVKSKYNYISDYDICKNEKLIENNYCKKYVTQDFDMRYDQVAEYLNDLIESDKKTEVKNNNIFIRYWYVWSLALLIVFIIIITIFINRRRSRL